MQKVLVLNGPNLGRLGRRQPEVYGTLNHDQLAAQLVEVGAPLGLEVEVRQTNHEGQMVDWLNEAADQALPVVINPGAWAHYSLAVADAVAQLDLVVEVHLSNVHAREEFRKHLVVSPYVRGVIAGLGSAGYAMALAHVAEITSRG